MAKTRILRRLIVARLPPEGQLRLFDRARLTVEILAAYGPLRGEVRRNDLTAMVARARTSGFPLPATQPDAAEQTAVRLGKMVIAILRVLPTDGRCLVRSLVLLRLLAVRRIDATVVIGVHDEGGFGAHAWVEVDGRAVLPAGSFAPLVVL